jgi:hypothetical protein
MKRAVPVLLMLSAAAMWAQQSPTPRIDIPVQERLELPQRVSSASLRLTDFVGFIATSYKVPMLVEFVYPQPTLTVMAGTYSARQLLDHAVSQLHGYRWKSENGVAHLYHSQLVKWRGNLLNVKLRKFYLPVNVTEFIRTLRSCVANTAGGYGCTAASVSSGCVACGLEKESLPYLERFDEVTARAVLLRALQANGRFFIVIAFDSVHPKLSSDVPFLNWFTQSLVPDKAAPM